MAQNTEPDKVGGMGESTPYRLFRAMQEMAGLTKAQMDDLLDHHQTLLWRLGETYRSRSNALPSALSSVEEWPEHSGEQTQPV